MPGFVCILLRRPLLFLALPFGQLQQFSLLLALSLSWSRLSRRLCLIMFAVGIVTVMVMVVLCPVIIIIIAGGIVTVMVMVVPSHVVIIIIAVDIVIITVMAVRPHCLHCHCHGHTLRQVFLTVPMVALVMPLRCPVIVMSLYDICVCVMRIGCDSIHNYCVCVLICVDYVLFAYSKTSR